MNSKTQEALKALDFLRCMAVEVFDDNTAVSKAYEEVKTALAAQPAAQVPERWRPIDTAPKHHEVEITNGEYVVRARLEDVDYSEYQERPLYGWVPSQFSICDEFPAPTGWREITAAPPIAE